MNKTIFLGRTTRDVDVRYSQGGNPMAIGRFSIAVDTGYGDKKKTNFFNCTIFGKQAEAFEKYVKKGTKVLLECEANQEQYKDKNGNDVNTVSFIVRNFEFAESKSAAGQQASSSSDGFMSVPDGLEDELPFN